MKEGLSRPLTKTTLGLYWDLESLYESILNERSYGFYQEESGYSGVFNIARSPLRSSLNVFCAGKDFSKKTPINDSERDAFFAECAKLFQCDTIVIKGRAGWKKRAESRGYREDSRVYVKEV